MKQPDQSKQRPPVRRKKKSPKWKRMIRKYWPPIRFCLIIIAFLTAIILIISGVVRSVRNNNSNETNPSGTNQQAEASTEQTLSQVDVQLLADAVLADAEFIAAGYDYEKAIHLLQGFEYYDDVPELAEKVAQYQQLDGELVSYSDIDKVTHVFFHSLIADPARAFDGEYTSGGYNQYMTTVDEFNAILEQMYARGYILVSPYDIAYEVTDETGTHFTYGDIRIPEGKIPFIMSQDDVNYYGYMISAQSGVNEVPAFADTTGDGFASRIVIGEDGYPTCEYMDENGIVTTGNYDLVPLLEEFIQAHPDFSYHGARAVLGITGYEGVFGYRTKPSYESTIGTEAYQKEVQNAKAVAQCLKDHGWILACHSYGHPAYGQISAEKVEIDSDKWESTVQPIIGNTDIILYPYGSDIAGIEKYTFDNAKFSTLYEDGYRYFFNVDGNAYWCQLGTNYFRAGRRNLDGYRMYYNPEMLDDLFDVASVFDSARPTPVPSI